MTPILSGQVDIFGTSQAQRSETRSDVEHDETTWVDTVPVRPARTKRITINEFEWTPTAPADDQPARLTAPFMINNAEFVAVLVEDTTPAHAANTGQTTGAPQPRLRLAGRSYLLSVEPPAQAPVS